MPRLSVRRPANGRAPRTLWWVSLAAAGLLSVPSPGRAQVTVFNSNGFESPSYNNSALAGYWSTPPGPGSQQGWLTTDLNQFFTSTNPAGAVQNGTACAASQAFEVIGSRLANDSSFAGQTFSFRNFPAP